MQDVNLLQGLVRRVVECRAVRDDHRMESRGVRIPGSITSGSSSLGPLAVNGEVGFAVAQPRQMLLELGESRSTRGPSRELATLCSVALQASVCFFAGLTSKHDARGARSHIIARRLAAGFHTHRPSSHAALPLQLPTPTPTPTPTSSTTLLSPQHAHRHAAAPRRCRDWRWQL